MCLFYQHCSEPIYVVETNNLKQKREKWFKFTHFNGEVSQELCLFNDSTSNASLPDLMTLRSHRVALTQQPVSDGM